MIPRIKQKIEKLDRSLPRRNLALLPAEAFICRRVDIPEGTPQEEVPGLVQLSLETSAPFPIESLAWGFLSDGKGQAFAYAAPLSRACPNGTESLASCWHALPAFVPFVSTTEKDCVRLCTVENSAIALYLKAGSPLPEKVLARPLKEPLPDMEKTPVNQVRSLLLAALGLSESAEMEDGLWTLTGSDCTSEDRVQVSICRLREGMPSAQQLMTLGGDSLWNADARGHSHAQGERKNRRAAHMVWLAFKGGGYFAASLAIAQAIVFLSGLAAGHYESSVKDNQHLVKQLEDEADLANILEGVSERQTKPFAMLAAANRKRPAPLYFERVTMGEWNVLRVEGQAQRTDQVQGYIEALNADPDVTEVRNVRTSSTGGRASFDFEIVFAPLPELTRTTGAN
ncbi:MAG: hypothetical protein JW942_02895 [Opitutales bacterium]|nr:hypothetical protein [Opitutales bacterium]